MTTASLETLDQVELNAGPRAMLAEAQASCGGDAPWRGRKLREAHQLLALAQVAPGRLEVGGLDLREDFRALLRMRVPVPCRPDAQNRLRLAEDATLGLTYPRLALRESLPGAAFVLVLDPRDVWLPSVRWPDQPLCLGASLPPGARVRSIVLMTYGALSAQTLQVDEVDPAGVFNAEAALWWQQNLHRAPLTRRPFLAVDERAPASGATRSGS